MSLSDDILALASEHFGASVVVSGTEDILGAMSFAGDDATDFLENYAERFKVDLSDMRWEFHFNADEPPFSRRVIPVDVDGNDIPFDPITLDMLVTAAGAGKWQYDYPEHTLRYWSLRSVFFVALAVLTALYVAARLLG